MNYAHYTHKQFYGAQVSTELFKQDSYESH